MEDSNPEEQSTSPDTPVVFVAPEQLLAPADAQHTGSPNYPIDVFLDTNCPLSETLRNLQLETLGYHLDIILKFSAFLDILTWQTYRDYLEFSVTLLSAVSWSQFGFQTAESVE